MVFTRQHTFNLASGDIIVNTEGSSDDATHYIANPYSDANQLNEYRSALGIMRSQIPTGLKNTSQLTETLHYLSSVSHEMGGGDWALSTTQGYILS